MKSLLILKRIKKACKSFFATLKYGGYNTVQIHEIEHKKMLSGKTILVTGAGSGIGLAISKKCLDCGAKVIMTGRNEEKLKSALQELCSDQASYIVWDISDVAHMSEKLEECIDNYGDIDVLVNNAGIQPKEFFPNVTEKEWDAIYNVNSKGTFFITEELCKRWMDNSDYSKLRKIINIDSQGGFLGATYPYRMTKWDIRGLTRGLGAKMAPYGVAVNGIAPGVVRTDMQNFSLRQGDNLYCNQNILERVCLPEEIAELAAYMISDACTFMIGQTILIDGGASLN